MDISTACDILDINKNYSLEELRKKYRMYALKFHPDRNKSTDANEKFREIHEAYTFLSENIHNHREDEINNDYNNIFQSFLKSLLVGETISNEIVQLITNIVEDYKNISMSLLEKLNKNQLTYVYEFVSLYRSIFHFDEEFINSIFLIINKKNTNDNMIILNTSLNDLINNNIYVLEHENNTYYIPLWHNELYYDLEDDKELIVKCIPKLDEHIFIDHLNDIYIDIRCNLDTLLCKKNIEYKFGNDILYIPINHLYIKRKQQYKIKNKGIPMINTNNIYNIEDKSDIIFTIELY